MLDQELVQLIELVELLELLQMHQAELDEMLARSEAVGIDPEQRRELIVLAEIKSGIVCDLLDRAATAVARF